MPTIQLSENIMEIQFVLDNGWYVASVGNIEVRVSYDKTSWHLNYIVYRMENECSINWWCAKQNCDMDDLGEEEMAEDECCFACPRVVGKSADEDSYASNGWAENPKTLEEARKLILASYIERNGIVSSNKDVCDVMNGKWVVKA